MEVLSSLELNKDVGIVFTGIPGCANDIVTIKKDDNDNNGNGLHIGGSLITDNDVKAARMFSSTVSACSLFSDIGVTTNSIISKPESPLYLKSNNGIIFFNGSEFNIQDKNNNYFITANSTSVTTGNISEFGAYNMHGQSLNIHANGYHDSVLGKIDATRGSCVSDTVFRISSNARCLELKNDYDNGVVADRRSRIALEPDKINTSTYCFYLDSIETIRLRADNKKENGVAGEISLCSVGHVGGTVISLQGGGFSAEKGIKTNITFSQVDDVIFCTTNVNVMDGNINVDNGYIELNGCNGTYLIFNNRGILTPNDPPTLKIGSSVCSLQSHIIHRNIFDEQQNCVGFIRFDFPNILPATCTIDVGFKLDNALKGSRTEFVAFKSDIPSVNHLEFANPTIPANCSLYEVSLAPTTFTKTPIMQLTNKSGAAQVADLCYNKLSNKVFVGIDHTAQIDAGEYKLSVFGM